MKDEEKNKLEDLKEQVLKDLIQLSGGDDMSPDNKFRLMINLAIMSGNPESFEKAKQAASAVEDETLKAQLLMELLEEIDITLGNITVGETSKEEKSASEKNSVAKQQP